MPTEFYRYAERTADSQINWAQVGFDLTNTYEEEAKIREQKKAAIDEATNQTLKTLANAPRGEAIDGNNFTINYSHDATQSMLMQSKLLKAGKLNPKDYALFMANINSGTDQLFNLQKEYQAQFSRKMERMHSNDPKTKSQSLEGDYAAYLEGFGDLSKSKALINPATGLVNVGIMKSGPDGVNVLSDKTMAVSDVYKGLAQDYNYFDSLGTSGIIASKLAPVVIETIKSEGSIGTKGKKQTIDNALQKENTRVALDKAVESFMDIPYNVSSVLTNDIGTYHNVFSEEERAKDPKNAILWKVDKYGNLSTEFSKEQKDAAKDYLMTLAKAQVHEKITTDVFESAAKEVEDIKIRKQQLGLQAQDNQLARDKFEWDKIHGKNAVSSAVNLDKKWSEKVNKLIPVKLPANEDNAVDLLDSILGPYGYEAFSARVGTDAIYLKSESGQESPAILLADPNAKKTISEWVQNHKDIKDKSGVYKRDYMKLNEYQKSGLFGNETEPTKPSPKSNNVDASQY